jgi:predicted MPP superfamily phosphohydrolase
MARVAVASGIIGIQALIVFILVWGLKVPKKYALWIIVLFFIFNLPLPYILWLQSSARQPPFLAAVLLVRPCFAWLFNWICFLIFLAPILVIFRIVAGVFGFDMIITVMRWAVFIIALLTAAATGWGIISSAGPPVIERHQIKIKGLSPRDDGLRLVQLSDPHVAWWNSKEEVCRTGEMIAGLKPDLFVITGDVADHNPNYVHALADCLEGVRPWLGRYAIIGNHDVYTGKELVARRMEQRGFRMLRDEWISLEHKGAGILLAGIDDSGLFWTQADPHEKNIPEILADIPPGFPVILLAHRPSAFEHVRGLPVALTLTGHTHGGQLRLPFGGPGLADISFKQTYGIHHRGDQTLYVSRGTGTVGWPFRLFCPKEITLFILKSG